jgi:hypothetical protein
MGHIENESHLAHGGLQHFEEQQDTFCAQPSPEDFLLVVHLQEPLKHGIQTILKEEAEVVRRPEAAH